MKITIAAGAIAYSIRIATPVRKPPQGPNARRAKPSGVLTPLPQQNIDTGGGLERFSSVIAGLPDAYATDLFQPTIQRLAELSGVPYNDIESVQHRIIADHVRSVSMCIADGILPANDGAGYVIKMLIRRASRQAYILGLREPVLYKLVAGVVEAMGDAYPEVRDAQGRIEGVLEAEEAQFLRTLGAGIVRVSGLLDGLGQGSELSGEIAFDLWQTYGFPLSLTEEMAEERGVTVDRAGYETARQGARDTSRTQDARIKQSMAAEVNAAGEVRDRYGDTVFVASTGAVESGDTSLLLLQTAAVEVVAEAIRDAVRG